MASRIKLLLLIPHLGGGGAEKVAFQLAHHLDPARFEIHLVLFTKDNSGAQPPPEWVKVTRFHVRRVRHAWLPLISLIRAQRPDVILSGMAHLNFLVLSLKPFLPHRTRIMVRQNTTASSAAKTWLSRFPYHHLYPRADMIICQSEAMANDLATNFSLPKSKLTVLANPISVSAIAPSSHSKQENWPADTWPRLLSVGRLAREKGLDLLLHAMAEIKQQHPQIHLQILGTGPEESLLRQLTQSLNLESAVTFGGHRQDLANFYPATTVFVLSSRYEGLPNALLEAAGPGLPLVATPCSEGVCDLLRDAPGTWLTPTISAESLAKTTLAALAYLTQESDIPQRFQHGFLAPFQLNTAIAAYAALIEQAALQGRP
jgi:glycosyltransferase involved in cell wall biosynthesis